MTPDPNLANGAPTVSLDRLSPAQFSAFQAGLSRWDQARRHGHQLQPADVFPDDPVLQALFQARIAVGSPAAPVTLSLPGPADVTRSAAGGAPPPAPAAPAAGPPGYELLGELGHGGMGVVYKARQTALNREVALKVVLAGARARPQDRVRFLQEAEAAARVHHPHVAQVFECGTWDGQPFLALEFCPGGSLKKKLDGKPVPPGEAARLVASLAGAVAAAHAKGVVHRDLKPDNVLLAADGTPKVSDFGLAKFTDSGGGLTQTGVAVGTPSYMSPEQARGDKAVGPPTDVWALGAILYECLTGRPPFLGSSVEATLAQVERAEPVSPRQLQPAVPRDVETICLKCLEKDPRRRFESAQALADDLRRFLDGKPIVARPVGTAERAVKWVRRNPARCVGLLSSFALVVCAVIALNVWLTARADARGAAEAREWRIDAAGTALRRDVEFGRWEDALAALDALTAERVELGTEHRFHRALAEYHLGRLTVARQEFESLAALPSAELGPLKPRIDLYLSNFLLDTDPARAAALIRAAVQADGLSRGEQLYGQGLLASTSREALDLFVRAQDADQTLQEARSFAIYLCIMSGNGPQADRLLERSRCLFPDRREVVLSAAILAAVRRDRAETERAHRDVRRLTGDPLFADQVVETCRMWGDIQADFAVFAGLGPAQPAAPPVPAQPPAAGRWRAVCDRMNFPRPRELGLPPSLEAAARQFAVLEDLPRLAVRGGRGGDIIGELARDDRKRADFARAVEADPNCLGLFLLGQAEFDRSVGLQTVQPGAGLWTGAAGALPIEREVMRRRELAAVYLGRAAYAGGLIDVRMPAAHGAVLLHGVNGSPKRLEPDLKARAKAAELLRDFLASNLLPNQWTVYAKVAEYAEDWKTARQIADRWLLADPKNGDARKAQVMAEFGLKNFESTIRLGRAFLQRFPEDAEVRQAVESARARLVELVDSKH